MDVTTAFERGVEPNLNQAQGEFDRDGALADGDAIGVVVQAGPGGGFIAPNQSATTADHPIGGHGFAITRTTEDDAAFHLLIGDGERDRADEARIIARGLGIGPEIHDFVALVAEVFHNSGFVVKSCMIGADANFHWHTMGAVFG